MSIKQEKKKRTIEAFFPLIGAILAIVLGVFAWAFAPALLDWSVDTFDGFSGNELNEETLLWGFRIFIFLVGGAFASTLVAFAVPKRKSTVTTNDMKKEKAERDMEKRRRDKTRKKVRKQNAKQTKRIE